ncbi:MAG TPA: hypothetical protein VGN75_16780 [Kaistia sp.]|jgi:hypothetical protein|nr:hypothetical protein [Kaistia sp.]
MSEMVEKVARAICVGRGLNPDECTFGTAWANDAGSGYKCSQRRWEKYKSDALAAIAAMREPTAEMKAAEGAHWDYSCHTCGGLAEGWDIMIDAALAP